MNRDNREIISNTIDFGNVNKFNIGEGEHDWLGQLNISNSMNIIFKGNTKISNNNNNSIINLFNLKRQYFRIY